MEIKRGELLAPWTTLGVGGPADAFVQVTTATQLQAALTSAAEHGSAVELLGEGSNVVISDEGLRGLTVALRGGGITRVGRAAQGDVLDVDGGMAWDEFVAWTVEQGLAGVELLSGIPGTVGAAPVQNIAAYGQALADVVTQVEAVERATGDRVVLDASECAFGYRDSRFKRDWDGRYVITAVRFALSRTERTPLTYRDLDVHFDQRGGDRGSLVDRRAAVLAVRGAKSMVHDPADPLSRSCGSFFISPWLPRDAAVALVDDVRGEGAGDRLFAWYSGSEAEDVKVPAAMVLLAAGFRNGDRWGPVGLSPRHVLAIVNLGGATAQRVSDVAGHIAHTVRERLGVTLQAEPRFLGAFEPFDPDAFAASATFTSGSAGTPAWAGDSTR